MIRLIGLVLGMIDGWLEGRWVNRRTKAGLPSISTSTHFLLFVIRIGICGLITLTLYISLWYTILIFFTWDIVMRPTMNLTRHLKYDAIKISHMGHGMWEDLLWGIVYFLGVPRGWAEFVAFLLVTAFELSIILLPWAKG